MEGLTVSYNSFNVFAYILLVQYVIPQLNFHPLDYVFLYFPLLNCAMLR